MHELRDPDEFGFAVTGARLMAEFLRPQREPTRVEQFQHADWALDFHEAQVKARIIGPLPAGWASMGLMRGVVESSWYGCPAGRGVLVSTPPGEVIDGHIAPGFQCLAVTISPELWERGRLLAGVEDRACGGPGVHALEPLRYERLERRLRSLRRLLRASATDPRLGRQAVRDSACFAVEIAAIAWELGAAVAPHRAAPGRRARLARQAEAWMRAHLGEAVQVTDVCLALGVGRRELEYAFRHAFDESPRDYLQSLRLNAIRRALRRRDSDPVKTIALSHGVTHLGRFAAHYHALFGETPRATLGRG